MKESQTKFIYFFAQMNTDKLNWRTRLQQLLSAEINVIHSAHTIRWFLASSKQCLIIISLSNEGLQNQRSIENRDLKVPKHFNLKVSLASAVLIIVSTSLWCHVLFMPMKLLILFHSVDLYKDDISPASFSLSRFNYAKKIAWRLKKNYLL